MASGISGFGFNAQFNFQAAFSSSTNFATGVPYTGSNFGAYQTQQTSGFALSALGQLQGSYLDILGGNSYGGGNSLFPGQPEPFASFNNVFVPSGASPFASFGNNNFPQQPSPFASFNNVFVGNAAPFASFNNVFVPSGASPFASFGNNSFPQQPSPFASFNKTFVGGAAPVASFNNVFVPSGATPFASFGGTFPGQPLFGQGTGAIALFPATQFIPFG
jgi:hypothetical protein